MRRHRKQRDQGSVEMNLAAMLDMAFQLLTFFILTFRPAPIEGQLAVHLPPEVKRPLPNVPVDLNKLGPVVPDNDELTLHLYVTAGPGGEVSQLTLEKSDTINGPLDASRVQTLDKKLQSIFALDVPIKRAQIAVDPALHYGELMKIVDVCSRQKTADGDVVKKISFTEL